MCAEYNLSIISIQFFGNLSVHTQTNEIIEILFFGRIIQQIFNFIECNQFMVHLDSLRLIGIRIDSHDFFLLFWRLHILFISSLNYRVLKPLSRCLSSSPSHISPSLCALSFASSFLVIENKNDSKCLTHWAIQWKKVERKIGKVTIRFWLIIDGNQSGRTKPCQVDEEKCQCSIIQHRSIEFGFYVVYLLPIPLHS